MPRTLLIMRHAEKSADLTDPHLTDAGRQRAAALAAYVPSLVPRIVALYATAISKHSNRPSETLQPLAAALGLAIDQTYADQDYGALAAVLLKGADADDGSAMVVSWHHGNIPPMLAALGAPAGAYPAPWPEAVFNLIVRVDVGGAGPVLLTRIVEPF